MHNGGEGECIDLTSLHELAPLYVQTRFPSSDIDSVRPCHFSIVQACSALILIWILRQIRSAGVGSQTSLTLSNLAMATMNGRGAVRFRNFDSTLFRSSCSQIRR